MLLGVWSRVRVKKMKHIFSLSLWILAVGCAHRYEGPRPAYEVNYIPFNVGTLTPVTKSNMGRGEPCVLAKHEDMTALDEMLNSAAPTKEPFGESFVRVRIMRWEQGREAMVGFIDQAGMLEGDAWGLRRLSRRQREVLESFLAPRCK